MKLDWLDWLVAYASTHTAEMMIGCGILLVLFVLLRTFLDDRDMKKRRAAAVVLGGAPPPPSLFLTLEELKAYDGVVDKTKPLLVGIRGTLYDVSGSKDFYGPGCAYHCFTGCDATLMLATMSLKVEDKNKPADKLSLIEQDTLNQWEMKFETKYPVVGYVCHNDQEKEQKRQEVAKRTGKGAKTQ